MSCTSGKLRDARSKLRMYLAWRIIWSSVYNRSTDDGRIAPLSLVIGRTGCLGAVRSKASVHCFALRRRASLLVDIGGAYQCKLGTTCRLPSCNRALKADRNASSRTLRGSSVLKSRGLGPWATPPPRSIGLPASLKRAFPEPF